MEILRAYNVPSILQEAIALINEDKKQFCFEKCDYVFRGESHNFDSPYSDFPSEDAPTAGLFRHNFLKHEHEIYNEAIRTFPEQFRNDKTTFERLTRMQHYGYKTRLLDVTPKLLTAVSMIFQPDGKGNSFKDQTGFIHVYRVKRDRCKYSTGDTVTALANLAKIKPDHILLDDLSYLAYECKNERAGFHWERKGDRANDRLNVSEKLDEDIGHIWYVKPIINNPRIDFQVGEFFLFGCGDRKTKLETTFSIDDFLHEHSATYGIARIGVIAISPEAKNEVCNNIDLLDIGLERVYPDFCYHSQRLNERYEDD